MPRREAGQLTREILGRLEQVSLSLLLPVFFVVAGLQVDVGGLGLDGLWQLGLILLVAIGGKVFGTVAGARVQRLPRRSTWALALLMNTRGLTELVILQVGLQLGVLDQVRHPALVACYTMNYWIQSKRDLLLELLRHIDLLMINDSEARELSGDWNVYRAAQWVLAHGPRMIVIKQGEHGALLVDRTTTFKVPAYPLQEVFDPTGAGDAFAGGFMGHVARTGDLSAANLRLAMVYGAAMGSFAVEEFGIRRCDGVDRDEVEARVRGFRDLVHFDHGLGGTP